MELLLPPVTNWPSMAGDPLVHPDDDAWLVAAFASGNGAAFDRLYERHKEPLYRFVRRLVGRQLAAQVDEVFQDTWLRGIKAANRYSPQGASFRTWLFTVARHRAFELLRQCGREVELRGGDDDESLEPAGEPWVDWPMPTAARDDEVLFWRRAGERLLQCLDELPAAQRVVFLLHHDEDRTLDDVARALELGFETAKSRLRYAMTKLRLCMGAYLAPDVMGSPR